MITGRSYVCQRQESRGGVFRWVVARSLAVVFARSSMIIGMIRRTCASDPSMLVELQSIHRVEFLLEPSGAGRMGFALPSH